MNKEEILKRINIYFENTEKHNLTSASLYKTIKGLLDLYNKEVEKNKKLENDNQVLRETLYGGNVDE